jgi:hypothetical protein
MLMMMKAVGRLGDWMSVSRYHRDAIAEVNHHSRSQFLMSQQLSEATTATVTTTIRATTVTTTAPVVSTVGHRNIT